MRLTSKVLHLSAHIETVLLDMDGTLLDLHFDDQVWNYTLPARLAVVHGESVIAARARVAATLGDVRGSLNWYCLDHWTATFGISMHALEEELAHLVAIREGTLAFLEFLCRHGYHSVLATNAHPASLARKLQLTGLAAYFSSVISAHTLGRPKEDLRFWSDLRVREQFDPATTILVDDNAAALSAARASGVRHVFGIRYPSSTGAARSYPEFASVDALSELIPWLNSRRC